MSRSLPARSVARAVVAMATLVPCVLLLAPAFVLAAVITSVSAVVRRLAALLEPRFEPWRALIEFDARLGWRPRPRLNAHYLATADDVFRVITDEEGWPGRRRLEDSRVVVIGDSFAFGYGVDARCTFAARARRLEVKAVGAPGYSLVHGVRLMEDFGERLGGRLVVWFTFLENDLQDNLAPDMRGYRAPFVRFDALQKQWAIVDSHLSPVPWTCSRLDTRRLFASFCTPGPLADRAYSACDYLIERAHGACRRAGAELAIITIPHLKQLTASGCAELAAASGAPHRFDAGYPDRRIADICRRHGVPLLSAMNHLTERHYKRREGIHWNEAGHREIARLLERLHGSFTAGRLREYVPAFHADPRAAAAPHASPAPALARSPDAGLPS